MLSLVSPIFIVLGLGSRSSPNLDEKLWRAEDKGLSPTNWDGVYLSLILSFIDRIILRELYITWGFISWFDISICLSESNISELGILLWLESVWALYWISLL